MWRRPQSLLSKGPSSSSSVSFHDDLVQGHLLCASEEFPLNRASPLSTIVGVQTTTSYQNISDSQLFGDHFEENLSSLLLTNSAFEETGPCYLDPMKTNVIIKARPSFRKAWSRLSIRSIEPINYSIVDLSHHMQGGRNDGIYGEAAVLDTIPYSRVFFHAHPGAIITHRGKKYEIVSMTQPPAFSSENFSYKRSLQLAAYVRPTKVRYFTRPVSKTTITVVKQLESVEILENKKSESFVSSPCTDNQIQALTFAGCGAVSVKRQVRGYKKMSSINYTEISRAELSLPPIEYDTFGLFMCADPLSLSGLLGERFGPGVHALSHALCIVAPLFAVGLTVNDVECDHEFYAPTRVTLFDQRAGGSGGVQRLWECFFRESDNILEVAIDLLKNCSSCLSDPNYDGGCPACIHASQCLKFNAHLSRSAAIAIGERMLERIKTTDLYKSTVELDSKVDFKKGEARPGVDTTPRRRARQNAMRQAKELHSARDRQFVVGRVTWPLDQQQHDRLEHAE
jgi:DEAD/DEAH box helicase domain-containing protein